MECFAGIRELSGDTVWPEGMVKRGRMLLILSLNL
jgi:hypothetical protein